MKHKYSLERAKEIFNDRMFNSEGSVHIDEFFVSRKGINEELRKRIELEDTMRAIDAFGVTDEEMDVV